MNTYNVAVTGYDAEMTADMLLRVHELQADQYHDGNVLAAVGNAIYSITDDGGSYRIAGNATEAGYKAGFYTNARFNLTAGLTQVSYGIVLISDQNNQCLRRLDRITGHVSIFAGECGNGTRYYEGIDYIQWSTFNKPSRLQYDANSRKIYLLDVLEFGVRSAILSKNYYQKDELNERVIHITTHGGSVNDFIYDSIFNTYTISDHSGVSKLGTYGSRSTFDIPDAFGLARVDDVLIVSRFNSGAVMVIDERKGGNISICGTEAKYHYGLPYCSLSHPTSVAVVGGYLYIGSTVDEESWPWKKKAIVTKVSLTTAGK